MTEQNWQRDSDMVFTAVSTGDFEDYKMAEQAVVMLYVPDMSVSRGGISHALKRLERFYAGRSNAPHERAAEGGPLDAVVVRQNVTTE